MINVLGCQFGKLKVISFDSITNCYHRKWLCQCNCGVKKVISENSLKSGHTKSCGCIQRLWIKKLGLSNMRHGNARRNKHTSEYNSWKGLKQRCLNSHFQYYKYYGGRGIKVCLRWLNSYKLFLQDMGYKPTPKHSIDRIDNNGNYEPSNCRWVTSKQQSKNRRPKQ